MLAEYPVGDQRDPHLGRYKLGHHGMPEDMEAWHVPGQEGGGLCTVLGS